jgi:hypothetical protein
MNAKGRPRKRGRVYRNVTVFRAQARGYAAAVRGVSRAAVQYSFKRELVDEKSMVYRNDGNFRCHMSQMEVEFHPFIQFNT